MKNVKHTPGPWIATLEPRVNVKAADKKSVCAMLIPAGKKTRPYEEHCANARLISAAPELLNALEYIMNNELIKNHAAALAIKAIAKATGGAE